MIKTSPKYEVSNLGNVRHAHRKQLLKPRKVPKGDYIRYAVWIADVNGKARNQKIHRLVAETFLPNPKKYSEVDHIDRNPANNKVENLRWACRSLQMMNSGLRCDNTSGERAIRFRYNRYSVCVAKKWYGSFATLSEAVKCRNQAMDDIMAELISSSSSL